jgi:hypothetical protein
MEFQEALELLIDTKMESVHTAFAAVVQAYKGHSKRTCDVVPANKIMLSDGSVLEPVPIYSVPVVFPSSQAGGILFPIKKGDTVLVVISECAIGNWLAGDGRVVEPEDATRFTMHDAIAIPGLWTTTSAPKTEMDAKSGGMEFNGALVEITSKGKVKVANKTTNAKVLLDDIWSETSFLYSSLATFASSCGASSDPALKAAAPILGTAISSTATARQQKIAKVAQLLE